mmetsp:Transcript_100792/g.252705  ORF Transcript_100792/g.252705 Transcript_100792/m.252705 type:complete len:239 (-) Transcript_100792:1267-1983(-)
MLFLARGLVLLGQASLQAALCLSRLLARGLQTRTKCMLGLAGCMSFSRKLLPEFGLISMGILRDGFEVLSKLAFRVRGPLLLRRQFCLKVALHAPGTFLLLRESAAQLVDLRLFSRQVGTQAMLDRRCLLFLLGKLVPIPGGSLVCSIAFGCQSRLQLTIGLFRGCELLLKLILSSGRCLLLVGQLTAQPGDFFLLGGEVIAQSRLSTGCLFFLLGKLTPLPGSVFACRLLLCCQLAL